MLYAELSSRRTRQVLGDLVIAGWVVLWVVLALSIHDMVTVLARPGEELASVGTSLASDARSIADALGDTPLVGDRIAGPFTGLAEAAGRLADVGQDSREAAHRLALWVSTLLGGAAIGVVALPYLLWRRAWMRRATAAARLREQPAMLRLLAVRALVAHPLDELRSVSDDPVRDAEERPELLAALTLRRLGLRAPYDGP